jgi:hypothetical protein
VIGEGTHERTIVAWNQFMPKLAAMRTSLARVGDHVVS